MYMAKIFNKEKWEKIRDDRKIVLKHLLQNKYKKESLARNWEIKLNRNINKKDDHKVHFGEYECARYLADLLNSVRKPGEAFLSAKNFVGANYKVPVIGEMVDGGTVIMYPKKRQHLVEVNDPELQECHCVVAKMRVYTNIHFFYKPSKKISFDADRNWGIAQCKKSKKILHGWLTPKGDGYYDIDAYCVVTGKKIQTLVSNCDLSWSSKIQQGQHIKQ